MGSSCFLIKVSNEFLCHMICLEHLPNCKKYIISILVYYSSLPVFFLYPRHDSGGVLWFHVRRPCVRPSVPPSVILFADSNLSKFHGFSPNLVSALILWRSGLGLLMDNFRQFLTELFARDIRYFYFRTITGVNLNGFSSNLICALILLRSELGLLLSTVRQFWT